MWGIKSMQVYSWKCVECTRRLARFLEFSFSDQWRNSLNSRTLGVWGSLWGVSCTYHRWRRKKRETKGVSGGLVEPRVRPFLPGFLSSCSSACCIVDVVHHNWGRDLEQVCDWWFGEISPHTYSCTWLYSKEKQKWRQGALPVLNTGEPKLYWIKECFHWEY